ncbi:hypothetical protein [Legionella sp. W05-934-2]|uniref:transglycosylase SLT domain-containing protein n=1 Tax=Legionella sp. W05-934-2 TaxID=1198649 RepID=UPI00346297EE
MLNGCVQQPPDNVNNVCSIFQQYPEWYGDAQRVQSHWQIPIPVQMAIIHQESRFNGRAKPPRTKLLWVIPWKRPSTASGYTQALNMTWQQYKNERGGAFASRDEFGKAVDFIGWYAHRARKRAGISAANAYALYLAYHEGIGGYMRKTYLQKEWLVNVARKVKQRAIIYENQLERCKNSLPGKSWYQIW